MMTHPLYFRVLSWMKPLPLPDEQERKVFKLPAAYQLGISLMLNILSLALPVTILQIYDRIIPRESYATLALLVTGVLLALTLEIILRLIRAYLVGWTAASHEHAAHCTAMSRLANAEPVSFEKNTAGRHLQNLNALGRLREFYSGQALSALADLPFSVLFLALVAYLGGVLVLVPALLLGLFFLCARYAGDRLKDALEKRSAVDDIKVSYIVSILSGFHTVKAMGMESALLRRFEMAQNRVTQESYRVAQATGFATTLSAVFGQLSLILTAAAGCLLVLSGHLSVGGLSACTLLAGRAIQPIQRVLGTWLRLQDLDVARHQAQELFNMPIQPRTADPIAWPAEGAVSLEGVSFGYAPDQLLLKKISLNVDHGEVIAISGDKSSGKSTLLQLMAGLLTPLEGTVQVNNLDPAQYSLSDLSAHIGYLPQQGPIFKGTILENMTGFRTDAETLEKARAMGIELGLNAVVDLLPHGYQTPLTDTSSDPIPPGVKQRIALTRVLIHQPSVLLFDNADRTLDKEGYNRLFRIMGRLKNVCTVIMTSYDQNLLSFADRFYTLDQGVLKPSAPGGLQTLSLLTQRKRED